jgi:hypothetical protein
VSQRPKREIQPTLLKWAWIGVATVFAGWVLFSTAVNSYYTKSHRSFPSDAKSFIELGLLILSAGSSIVAFLCFLMSFPKIGRLFVSLAALMVNLLILSAAFLVYGLDHMSFH